MPTNPRPTIKKSNLRLLTADTKFFIDYNWWDEGHLDLRTYILSRLNTGADLGPELPAERIDLVDSKTGEVRQVDAFQYLVRNYFSRHDDELSNQGSVVDAVFSVLLANGNEPMTAAELAERIQRTPELITKTFGGSQIYNGIRPLFDDD